MSASEANFPRGSPSIPSVVKTLGPGAGAIGTWGQAKREKGVT
jgi:hypothetical protein